MWQIFRRTFQYIVSHWVLIAFSLYVGAIVGVVSVYWSRDSIQVDNQPMGTLIRIHEVNLVRGGYVVLEYQREEGREIIGSSTFLNPGHHRNVLVNARYTYPFDMYMGQPCIAQLFWDNGDYVFHPQDDLVIRGKDNAVIETSFWLRARSDLVIPPTPTLSPDELGL